MTLSCKKRWHRSCNSATCRDSPSWTNCRSSFSSGGLFLGLGDFEVYIYLNLPVPQPILIRLTCGKTTRVAEGSPVLTCRCGLCGYRALVAGFATSKLESSMYPPSSSAGIGIICDQIWWVFDQSKFVSLKKMNISQDIKMIFGDFEWLCLAFS